MQTEPNLVVAGKFSFDESRWEFKVDDTVINFTKTEMELMKTFLMHDGHVLSRPVLLNLVWGYDMEVADKINTRTIDMTVARVRNKLKKHSIHIENIRGVGYKFSSEKET